MRRRKKNFTKKQFQTVKKRSRITNRWTVRKRKINGINRWIRIRKINNKIEIQVFKDRRLSSRIPIRHKKRPEKKIIKDIPKVKPKPKKKPIKKIKIPEKPKPESEPKLYSFKYFKNEIATIKSENRILNYKKLIRGSFNDKKITLEQKDKLMKLLEQKQKEIKKPKPKPEPKPIIIKPKPKRKKQPTPARIIKLLAFDNEQYQLFKKEELYYKIKDRKDFELIMLQVYNDHYKSKEAKSLENKDFRDFMENRYLNLIDNKKRAWENKRKRGLRKKSKRTGFKNLPYEMKLKHIDRWLIKNDFDIEGTELQMIIKGNPKFELDELKQEVMKHMAVTDFFFYEKFSESTDPDIRQGLREFERDIINQELGYVRSPGPKFYEEKFSKKQMERIEELGKLTKKQLMELVDSHTKYPSEAIRIYWLKDDIIKCMVRYEDKYQEKGKRFEQLDRSTKNQLIEKIKKNWETYSGYATMPEYWTKMDVIYWMIHKEAEKKNLGRIKASSIKQSEWVKTISPGPTMTKEFPHNIAKGVKGLAEGDREQSIAIDFERVLHQPQRMIAVEGGRTSTIRIDDFEIFGHTHPNSHWVMPSATDLLHMNYKEPEFIVAGLSGKIIFFNVEDPEKIVKWLEKSNEKGIFDSKSGKNPISSETLSKKYGQEIYDKYRFGNNLLKDKEGREIFFQETGVRAYPYKKGMKIEMRDDPHIEKRMPSVSQKLLYKWKYNQSPEDWEDVLKKQKVIKKKVYKKQSNLDKHLQINTKMLEEYGDLKTFDKKQTRIVKSPEISVWSKWTNMTPKELEKHLNSLTVEEIKQKSDYSKIQKYKRKSRIIEVLTKEINYIKAMSQLGK